MDKPAIARPPEPTTPAFSLWQLLGFLAGPLLFLFVYFLVRPDGMPLTATAVLASTALVATWAVTRAVPIPVVGLLPLVLFPVFGVADMPEAAASYADPTLILLLGGCLVALAGERWQLYRRLALSVVSLPGATPARLVPGFLTVTTILSAWLSTAVTVLIMLPIGLAVVGALQNRRSQKVVAIGGGVASPAVGTALILSIAYGATFGGLAAKLGGPLLAVAAVACGWLILHLACAPGTRAMPGISEMEPVSAPERSALIMFGLTVVLWIARPYLITPYLPKVDDATIAMAAGLLLFLMPAHLDKNEWLLTTEAAQKLPWGMLLLFGSGLAITGAARSSGLTQWIAGSLPPLLVTIGETVGPPLLALVVIAAIGISLMRTRK